MLYFNGFGFWPHFSWNSVNYFKLLEKKTYDVALTLFAFVCVLFGFGCIQSGLWNLWLCKNAVLNVVVLECTWWGIITGPPWFLLCSLWTNRQKVITFSRPFCYKEQQHFKLLTYWLSLCSKWLAFTLAHAWRQVLHCLTDVSIMHWSSSSQAVRMHKCSTSIPLPPLRQTSSELWWLSGGQEGRILDQLCAVVHHNCAHHMHTYIMSSSYMVNWIGLWSCLA